MKYDDLLDRVNVVLLKMDYGIHEQVIMNHDDSFTIFLNTRDCSEVRDKSFYHAMKHIENGDFYRNVVQEIEMKAHE